MDDDFWNTILQRLGSTGISDSVMSKVGLSVSSGYALALEYERQAHLFVKQVETERQLVQYHTLIEMAIKTLVGLKQNLSLPLDEDIVITLKLAQLLADETHNLDMAENYLSSLKERLRNHSGQFNERLRIEYWLLMEIPSRRQSKFHYKIALKNCEELIDFLISLRDTANEQDMSNYEQWASIFTFVSCNLNINLGKHRKVRHKFDCLLQMLNETKSTPPQPQWVAFILTYYVNFLLEQRYSIPDELLMTFQNINCDVVGPYLYVWKLLLELIIQIYNDENITNKLNEFKLFFDQYKDELSSVENDTFNISFPNTKINFGITLPCIFQYKDIKNVLLLLQSVSYLVNCYDQRANFSTKFLPKVNSTTRKLMKLVNQTSNNEEGTENSKSIHYWDLKMEWYNNLLEYVEFYQLWERLILKAEINDISLSDNNGKVYKDLLRATNMQLMGDTTTEENTKETLELYSGLIKNNSKTKSNEVKMIALLNSYSIIISLVSKDVERQENIIRANDLWRHIIKLFNETDLCTNLIWDCTVTILWIISHFESFTWNSLPSNDEEKNYYMQKLKDYYHSNRLVENDEELDNESAEKKSGKCEYSLKKALLLRILINYLGGKIIETDPNIICQISSVCFRISKQQKMHTIRYIMGLWHLMNCTVSMRPKEVTYTRAKLESLLEDMRSS